MQFSFIEDLREAGIADLVCDCSARFGNGENSLENALRHVAMWHCNDDQRKRRSLFFRRVALFLSPNPVLIDGGGHAAEQ